MGPRTRRNRHERSHAPIIHRGGAAAAGRSVVVRIVVLVRDAPTRRGGRRRQLGMPRPRSEFDVRRRPRLDEGVRGLYPPSQGLETTHSFRSRLRRRGGGGGAVPVADVEDLLAPTTTQEEQLVVGIGQGPASNFQPSPSAPTLAVVSLVIATRGIGVRPVIEVVPDDDLNRILVHDVVSVVVSAIPRTAKFVVRGCRRGGRTSSTSTFSYSSSYSSFSSSSSSFRPPPLLLVPPLGVRPRRKWGRRSSAPPSPPPPSSSLVDVDVDVAVVVPEQRTGVLPEIHVGVIVAPAIRVGVPPPRRQRRR